MDKYYGGFWLRVIAYCVDVITLTVVTGILGIISSIMGLNPLDPSSQLLLFAINLLVNFFYFVGTTCVFGGTLGKRILGLQVVDAETFQRVSIAQSMGRLMMQSVSIICIFLGYIAIGFSNKKQGWHDSAAGTLVVKDSCLNQLMLEEERQPFNYQDAA